MNARRTPTVTWPSALEHRWQQLRLLQARVAEKGDRALQQMHGVSLTEYLALAALAYSDDGGHLRQQVLADAIPLNQSSVSRLVARLERAGLSERYLCETDRRGVYTQITDVGRELVGAARVTYVRVLDELLNEVAEQDEHAQLVSQLRQPEADGAG